MWLCGLSQRLLYRSGPSSLLLGPDTDAEKYGLTIYSTRKRRGLRTEP